MNSEILNPPPAHGQPLFNALLKAQSADFRVDEVLDIDFSGSGEHLYLQIEKTAMNTDELVSLLQEGFGVNSADIGLCGLKDRHSVSTQWFSIRTSADASVFQDLVLRFNEKQIEQWGKADALLKSLGLVASKRHSRKLKRGAHEGNRFVITLRDVQPCQHVADESTSGAGTGTGTGTGMGTGTSAGMLEVSDLMGSSASPALSIETLQTELVERIERIVAKGFPAYIGAQRFGQGGQNLHRARQWFAKSSKRTSRQQRSLWLSAARSALFNVVCAARVRDATWDQLMDGEPAVLNGTGSYFIADLSDSSSLLSPGLSTDSSTELDSGVVQSPRSTLAQRIESFDIHPSAPWWGRGRTPARNACAEIEACMLEPFADLCAGLERAGLSQERRALRAVAQGLKHRWIDDSAIELSFSLAPGIFATTLLRELGNCAEPVRT